MKRKKKKEKKREKEREAEVMGELHKIKDLNFKANYLSNPEKAIKIYQEAVDLGIELGERELNEELRELMYCQVGRAYYGIGTTYRRWPFRDFNEARDFYKEALEAYKKGGDSKKVELVESELEKLELDKGKFSNKLLRKLGYATFIFCFLIGGFFLLNNFTGYAIMEINQGSLNLLGIVLFFIGIIGCYCLLKKVPFKQKKKTNKK